MRDGLVGHVLLDPGGGLLLCCAADLADHEHGVGVGIVAEELQYVDEIKSLDRVTADADGWWSVRVPAFVRLEMPLRM